MRIKRRVAALSFLWLSLGCVSHQQQAPATSATSHDVHLFGTVDDDGSVAFVASVESLLNSPAWNPETAEVPLGVPAAVAVAKRHFLETHPSMEDVTLDRVELHPALCCNAPPDRWYYSISFRPLANGERQFRRSRPVVLLLDGSLAREIVDDQK